ncbi:MAG: cupin domain-containing protein [Bacteroidetes bacterium]|nr:MAG: cupin domain-containing protein [Bacteroidota bacterium]
MKRLTIRNALKDLEGSDSLFAEQFTHGSLVVEFYQPGDPDLQQPHSRDEIYVVASGTGAFINDGIHQEVETGEVLFVRAGIEHRFVEFSTDFSTWVFFYGPEGGEQT